MSALQHIRDYLAIHMAGYDIETLMTHFETAVEAKVEEAVAEVRQEMADLRADLIKPVTGARSPEELHAALLDGQRAVDPPMVALTATDPAIATEETGAIGSGGSANEEGAT